MNYETFVESKTDSDSGEKILELTLDEQQYVAGGAGYYQWIKGSFDH